MFVSPSGLCCALMIILLIGIIPSRLPFPVMATRSCCTSSSPTYTTVSPLCSVTDPIPFHLVLFAPSTSIPISSISLATCAVCVACTIVLTFQQLMVIHCLRATMGPLCLWTSHWLWPKSIITTPIVAPPSFVLGCSKRYRVL